MELPERFEILLDDVSFSYPQQDEGSHKSETEQVTNPWG